MNKALRLVTIASIITGGTGLFLIYHYAGIGVAVGVALLNFSYDLSAVVKEMKQEFLS